MPDPAKGAGAGTTPNRRQGAILAGAAALVGAVLAFALEDDNSTVAGVKLQSLGVILLVAGVILIAGLWLIGVQASAEPSGGGEGTGGLRAVAGLIAVVSGITAVCILSAITITRLDGNTNKESIVAVTTSAFGIISAVVGAYLGIKTADTAKEAAAATHDARASERQVANLQAAVNELPDEQAGQVFAAVAQKAAAAQPKGAPSEEKPPPHK